MAGELFLPDFDTLGIRILTVIDAKTIAKDMLKTLHNLDSKGNLRQKVEHLFLLFQCLTDEMDIDLCLSAGGNSMKQGHILFQERELYLVIGILLDRTQGLDVLQMRIAAVIQPTHLKFIGLQQTAFNQRIQCLQ